MPDFPSFHLLAVSFGLFPSKGGAKIGMAKLPNPHLFWGAAVALGLPFQWGSGKRKMEDGRRDGGGADSTLKVAQIGNAGFPKFPPIAQSGKAEFPNFWPIWGGGGFVWSSLPCGDGGCGRAEGGFGVKSGAYMKG